MSQLLRVTSVDAITGAQVAFDFYLDGLLTPSKVIAALKRAATRENEGEEPSASYEVKAWERDGDTWAFILYAEDLVGVLIVGFVFSQFKASFRPDGFVGVV